MAFHFLGQCQAFGRLRILYLLLFNAEKGRVSLPQLGPSRVLHSKDRKVRRAGEKWQTRRKILTPAFHIKILQQFVTIFNNGTNNLVEIIRKECGKPETDIVPFITRFTLYAINGKAAQYYTLLYR
ncbi:hypothetical protein NQ317_000086 [Molorchus minor]|uniref:Uncharacterized protein n=1 Tax=Molorchus minor TaxID=1323400 RepID=A0ABQ9IYB8_9CUCU|nr:hypothetical protein NQ317_000086 [Molorchus minor]